MPEAYSVSVVLTFVHYYVHTSVCQYIPDPVRLELIFKIFVRGRFLGSCYCSNLKFCMICRTAYKRGIEDNSKIIFLISQQKHML